MITGEIKNKLDRLWDAMWSNQMTNPWIDIQQVTYLIFIKMLDDNQIKQERKYNDMKANGIDIAMDESKLTFKSGNYVDEEKGINVPYNNLRWSVFKEFDSRLMFDFSFGSLGVPSAFIGFILPPKYSSSGSILPTPRLRML